MSATSTAINNEPTSTAINNETTSTAINNDTTSTAINNEPTSTAINTNTPNNKKKPYWIISTVLVVISIFIGILFFFLNVKYKIRKSYIIFVEILILILSITGVIIGFMFQRSGKHMFGKHSIFLEIFIGIMVAIVAFIFLIFNYKPLYDLFYLY